VYPVQKHLAFTVSRSSSCRPILLRQRHLVTARLRTAALQNPLHADEYGAECRSTLTTVVFSELQAHPSPWRPHCWFVAVRIVAVGLATPLVRPPEVSPRLREVQQQVPPGLLGAAALTVELHFDGGTELRFAAYLGAVAAEFRPIPLPASARPKSQSHGACHPLCGLALVTFLQANASRVSDR
jgi:hypothetical protein